MAASSQGRLRAWAGTAAAAAVVVAGDVVGRHQSPADQFHDKEACQLLPPQLWLGQVSDKEAACQPLSSHSHDADAARPPLAEILAEANCDV